MIIYKLSIQYIMTMYSPFSLLFFPITLTKKVDFSQASPSYEVAMEISKGKEKGIVLVFGF